MAGGARWRGHSHPELYDMINSGPGPGASDPQTQYWKSLTEELAQVDADLTKALGDLKATWQGSAAQTANEGMTPLRQWAGDAQTGSNVMGSSTELQADYIARARAEMPKPVPVTTAEPSAWQMATAGVSAVLGNPGPAAMVALQAADHERQEAAQSAAADKAVDTMNNYESSSQWNAATLGRFVPPPDVVVSTPMPAGYEPGGKIGSWMTESNFDGPSGAGATTTTSGSITTGGGGGGGGGGSTPPLPGTGGGGGGGGATGSGGGGGVLAPGAPIETTPSNIAPPAPLPPPGPLPPGPGPTPGPGPGPGPIPGPGPFPPGTGPLPNPGNGPGQNTGPNPGNKPGGLPTGPRGGLPGPGGLPGGGPGGGPGGHGGTPAGLGGLGGADADGRHSSQLGRGAAAMGMPGESVVGGQRGGPGAAGGGGARGGVGGAPMAGGRAQGDEDDEHFSPDYLLETTDVFGDDRLVSPAVIGEDPTDEEK